MAIELTTVDGKLHNFEKYKKYKYSVYPVTNFQEICSRDSYVGNVCIDFNKSPNLSMFIEGVIASTRGISEEYQIIQKVFNSVSEHYRNPKLEKDVDLIPCDENGTINLEEFFNRRTGACLETTITLGVILEELYNQGRLMDYPKLCYLEGRNDKAGHVWCEMQVDGESCAIDIAQGFLGLEEEHHEKIFRKLVDWYYS